MQKQLPRALSATIRRDLSRFPVVALVGPRQCGKTTLARQIVSGRSGGPSGAAGGIILDLERASDRAKLTDAETFLRRHSADLVCLDEIQRAPELFQTLRALVDEDRRPGRFLILGSASPGLLRQSSETLAGRISVLQLTPFLWSEIVPSGAASQASLWLRGGFPDSVLAPDDASSFRWREQFIRTFLERDVPQLGFRVPAPTLDRFWRMCAHLQGQVLNLSALGRSLGTTHPAVRHHVDLLEQTYVLRTLLPLEANIGKRLIKSPKVYLRDSGLLHALLDIGTQDQLAGHPVFGASWEGFVIEQCLSATEGWHPSHYRTATGDELDLVLERHGRRAARRNRVQGQCRTICVQRVLELASGSEISEAYVAAPVERPFPLGQGTEAVSIKVLLDRLR